jgi:hypothetical protein
MVARTSYGRHIKEVILTDAMRGMVGLLGISDQNPRLQLRPVLLPDPGEFEFLLLGWHDG